MKAVALVLVCAGLHGTIMWTLGFIAGTIVGILGTLLIQRL